MIKTSTLSPSSSPSTKTSETKEDNKLPEFAEPSESCINNILNYSKSLKVLKSELVKAIEVVHT